jgi:hypothetical protein
MRFAAKIHLLALALLALALLAAPAASADRDFSKYRIESAAVSLSTPEAGAHADFITEFTLSEDAGKPAAYTRDVVVRLPPGLIGNPQAFPHCTLEQFGGTPEESRCPQDAQVGVIEVTLKGGIAGTFTDPIYVMDPPGGDIVARFAFFAGIYPTLLNIRLDPIDSTLIASVEGASAVAEPLSVKSTFWGVPAAPVHDALRLTPQEGAELKFPSGGRPSGQPEKPFMANPTNCTESSTVSILARSYQLPEFPSIVTTPFPQLVGCGSLEFDPTTAVKPTTSQGTTGSGLDYELDFPTKGMEIASLRAGSHLKGAEVVLPEGMTVNPSEAEGLGVCSEADFARETYNSGPNVGCPETSKIGSVEAVTPIIDRNPSGSLYLAKPYDNPFGSLLALYMTLKIPDRGVLVKLKGKVTPDPETGQLVTVFPDAPQVPFASFKLHFREGARAPLVTPAACGTYSVTSRFTPWARPTESTQTSNPFQIESGPDHGPCPNGGLPPFHPDLLAGSINNAAGAYSPFYVHLSRTDSEQEFTNFSIKLPRGLLAKLAGVGTCSDAAIAAAQARTGPHGGAEELASPSCPADSEVGHTLAGAGVGQILVYAPGKLYLGGPYHGAPISLVSITAAKAGPFDLGTVVVRFALRVNPETGEVFVDSTGSDPIPHNIQGIPLRLRDIRSYVDRSNFTLNPTSCKATSTSSTALGSGLDFVSAADDNPAVSSTRYQAADCAALGFKPKLSLKLRGGTKRNQNPALTAVVRARPGDANIGAAKVTLPHSAFLAQEHIGTVCTRVQFNSGAGNGAGCPAESIYGKAQAITPLLDEPLSGPVYLRSNGGEHVLPDLVAALHGGKIDINLVGRIDTGKTGGIRSSFESVPDAPVTSFTLRMQGGKQGLIVNSTNLCSAKHRALAEFEGQNGKKLNFRPLVDPVKCKGKHRRKGGKHGHKRAR